MQDLLFCNFSMVKTMREMPRERMRGSTSGHFHYSHSIAVRVYRLEINAFISFKEINTYHFLPHLYRFISFRTKSEPRYSTEPALNFHQKFVVMISRYLLLFNFVLFNLTLMYPCLFIIVDTYQKKISFILFQGINIALIFYLTYRSFGTFIPL